jgi:uroporphyrinogen decarboxylase
LNARERVAQAIKHRETDRIPTGEIGIADGIIESVLKVDQVGFPERAEFTDRLGIDAVCESPEWPTPPPGLPDSKDARWKHLAAWATDTDRFVFAMLDGVFGWGTNLMGFEGFLAASSKRSEKLIALTNGVERLNTALAKQAVDIGADGILIADDIAYNQGTTINPQVLRDVFFPSLGRQLSGMTRLRIPVFFHSDGNFNAVIDDLVDMGFRGFQCLESGAGMDLARLKAAHGKRVCLWGNLDPGDLFLERSPEDLEKRVRDITDVAAPGGGFIFGTSSGLVEGMRPGNIETVYRAVSEGGSLSRS